MLNLVIMKSFSQLQSARTHLYALLAALISSVFTITYLSYSTEDAITRPVSRPIAQHAAVILSSASAVYINYFPDLIEKRMSLLFK